MTDSVQLQVESSAGSLLRRCGCSDPGLSSVKFVRRNHRIVKFTALDSGAGPSSSLCVQHTGLRTVPWALRCHYSQGDYLLMAAVTHRKPLDASGTSYKHGVLESTRNRNKVGPFALDGSQLWATAQSTWLPHSPSSLGKGRCQHKPRCPYV